MKAFILAAGLGTRLRPLTNDRPKALVEVAGKTLLEWNIRKLKSEGIRELIVNVHHFGQEVVDFLDDHNGFGLAYQISDERGQLLDTGGAIQQAAQWFDAPFLVYNVDVITNLNVQALRVARERSDALAVLAVRKRKSSRYLLFDKNQQLQGWRHARTGEEKWCGVPQPGLQALAFSGVHIIHPDLFDFFPGTSVFSIVDTYLAAGATGRILAYPHDDSFWMDAGKLEDLPAVASLLQQPPYTI
jgi:NDP-sugar pyrophosphorylase family protein